MALQAAAPRASDSNTPMALRKILSSAQAAGLLTGFGRAYSSGMSNISQIDWPATITAIKDVALAVAAGVTASVAFLGLQRWRLELEGKAHFEAARGLARAAYQVRNAIAAVRSPATFGHEYPESYKSLENNPPEVEAAALAHVYQARWEPLIKALEEFDAQSLEAEALWGEAIRIKTRELRGCISMLNANVQAYIRNKASGGEDFRCDRGFGKEVEQVIWDVGDETRGFNLRLGNAVRGIEELLLPHLRRK